MTILALDTSTARGSVALLCDGALVLDETFTADRSHTSALYPILERAMRPAPKPGLIVVGIGPGSYAGIRVAIATAIGLSLATGAELAGIPSVAALETGVRGFTVIGDARRDTFYFTSVEDGVCTEGPLLLGEAALREKLAADQSPPVFTTAPLPLFPATATALPSASVLARLAAAGRGITARGDLEPLYLREPHITTPRPRTAG